MKILKLALLMALFPVSVLAVQGSTPLPSVIKDLLNSGRPGAVQKARLGTQMVSRKTQMLRATLDYSVLGGSSGSTLVLLDEGGKPALLPDNAIIKQVIFDVLTDPTGTGASISVGAGGSTTNLKGATAVASWTGLVAGIPVSTAATSVKTSSEDTVKAAITGGDLASGKIDAYIEYFVGQ